MLPDTSPASSLVLLRSAHGLPCAKVLGLEAGRLAVVESYGRENRWRVEAHPVASFARYVEVLDAAAGLSDAIVIRGTIDPATPYDPAEGVLRRLVGSPNGGGHWTATARTWVPVDFDGAEVPPELATVEARVAFLVEALPAPFRGRSCWYQLTSSYGLDGDASKLRARLWFLADAPVSDAALVAALAPLPRSLHVDVSIYRGVQPIYIARPTFRDGIADPVLDRCGVVDGFDGELVDATGVPEPDDASARTAFAAYAKHAAAATAHPVELANARERILKGQTKGARHHHAMGAACELLVLGASADDAADVVGQVIAKQGREPVAGEVAGILAWAIAKHASGEVRAERGATATLLPVGDPAPTPGGPGLPPGDGGGGGGGGGDDGGDGLGGFGDFAPNYSANANANARAYLGATYPAPEGEVGGAFRYTFLRIASADYCWTGTYYRRMSMEDPPELDAAVQRAVGVAVTQTAAAVRRYAAVNGSAAAPFWIDPRPGDPPADMLVPFRNGLLDLGALVFDPGAELRPHTPRLFLPGCLPFDYDPAAKAPAFDAWVASTFDDEETRWEYRKLLGYCMTGGAPTPHNTQRSIAMLSGPTRSGKGVTLRLLQALVGAGNWTTTSLLDLGGRFGLASMVGKRLVTIGEMNDHKETAATQVAVDRLKMASGGDTLSIDRKNREILDAPLGAVFAIAFNRFPRLLDPSGALVGRMVVFRFERSHLGREDRNLEARLANELPGIAAQAVRGVLALLTGETLATPPGAREYVDAEIRGTVAPLRDFITDALALTEGAKPATLPRRRAYDAYRGWCAEHGRDRPLTLEAFCQDVTSSTPIVARRIVSHDAVGVRPYVLQGPGLRLTPEGEAWATANGGGFG